MRTPWLPLFAALALTACPPPSNPAQSTDDTDGGQEPGATLPGEPGTDARSVFPDLPILSPAPEDLVDAGPLSIAPNRIGVGLDEGATVGDVNAFAGAFDLELVGADAELGLLVFDTRSPNEDWLEDALAAADEAPAFLFAAPSVVPRAQRLPEHHTERLGDGEDNAWNWDTPSGGDWGLRYVGAPEAWNLIDYLDRAETEVPHVLVLDEAFDEDHPDLSFATGTGASSDAEDFHGTAVASFLASHWDNAGIESIFPASPSASDPLHVEIHGRLKGDIFVDMAWMKGALRRAQEADRPLIVNYSSGYDYWGLTRDSDSDPWSLGWQETPDSRFRDPDPEPGRVLPKSITYKALAARNAKALAAFVDSQSYDRFLITCSTGNENLTPAGVKSIETNTGVTLQVQEILAEHNSGYSHAATRLNHPHFIAVDALEEGGRISDYSSREGTLSAPGTKVGYARDGGYGRGDGTSYSAPMVGSAAMLLWTLKPDATAAEIKQALLDGAREASGSSGPRLDVPGAIEALLDGEDAIVQAMELSLADVDDGSLDGQLRSLPSGGTAPQVDWADRGDGCIDMADFRAFRDALLDALQADEGGHDGYDFEPTTNRDQQGDGRVRFIEDVTEADYSRFDLDLDGRVGLRDLDVIERQWGRCEAGAGPAQTRGVSAAELEGLIDSVDLWLDASVLEPGAVTLMAPGRTEVRLSAEQVAGATFDGHVLYTLPTSVCDGALNLRIRQGDTVRRYRSPEISEVFRGRDYRVRTADLVDIGGSSASPVAYRQGGGGSSELRVYNGSSLAFTFEDFEIPYSVGPISPSGKVQVAMPASGRGKVAVVIDGTRTTLSAGGPDLSPWMWADDGRGFLARSTTDERLFWADTEALTLREVAPDIDKRFDDWPAVHDGQVLFMGDDGQLYRAALQPRTVLLGEDLINDITGFIPALCDDDDGDLDAAAVVADLRSLGGVQLAHSVPSPVSSWGHVLLRVGDGAGGWNLHILKSGQTSPIPLVSGVDLDTGSTDLFAVDGTSWAWDSAWVAYPDDGGVWVADLLDGSIYDPSRISTSKLHDAPGFAVFDPYASLQVAVQSFTGPWHSPDSTVTVYKATGGDALAEYDHSPRCGSPSWSAAGGRLVLAQKPAAGVRWDARPSWADRWESKPGSFSDCDVVFVKSGSQSVVDDTAIEVYRTSSGGEAFADEAYPSWGVDFAR